MLKSLGHIWLLSIQVGILFFASTTQVGAVRLVDPKIDRWYRMEKDWGVVKTWPDKFQHMLFPYMMQEFNESFVGSSGVFWALNLATTLKELDDREGVSFRDILCNTIGLWGARYNSDKFAIVPNFEEQLQYWEVKAYIFF